MSAVCAWTADSFRDQSAAMLFPMPLLPDHAAFRVAQVVDLVGHDQRRLRMDSRFIRDKSVSLLFYWPPLPSRHAYPCNLYIQPSFCSTVHTSGYPQWHMKPRTRVRPRKVCPQPGGD